MKVKAVRDLRPSFGIARNQGSRPTCCAFACSDLHAASRSPWADLSCEYAFFNGVNRQGTGPATGVYLNHMLDGIEKEGQPIEAAWPYLSAVPNDLSLWKPPAEVGEVFHGDSIRSNGGIPEIYASIDNQQPVVVVMNVSDAFYGPDADGIVDSGEPVDPTRVHALVAIGQGERGSDKFILARNSWGTGWGISGYAWLSEKYLTPRIIEIATIKDAA